MRDVKTLLMAFTLLLAGGALAQTVKVEDAWARASVPGQQATGAFMTLIAPAGARLVGVSSPAAGVSEIHEMVMQGDVMKMRAIDSLELPAGKPVQLKPGGYHLMLMDLKAPLAQASTVSLTLVLRDAQGSEVRQDVQAPVRAVMPTPASASADP
ncbi:MAG: copper chaperone PCu(A)C [Burkholderiaceae bacterium]|jgi:copper(I)-binding protein|nr:copper chaperone PCu(A)C [Burkholderiaceae bacterium]